jgi:CHAT domain-containing protein
VAAVLRRDALEIVPLTPASRVRHLLRMLQFQLSKFRLGKEYVATFAGELLEATRAHLGELHSELLAPLRPLLLARRLVIVPHDFLHYVPFHALFDGQRYLVDDFAVSYAPSASVHHLCASKRARPSGGALVLGVPDPATPFIRQEVEAVAATLPGARLLVGEEATEEALRRHGGRSRIVHIATHGLFRYDNPMFSSLQLGSSRLSLFDLYQLDLSAELVTLSGCGTGLNVVEGGDELMGLVRGLLYAGARSALLSLWDVSDQSTADFMGRFYRRLASVPEKTLALQQAMREMREHYPHPYYWAPFVLVGSEDGACEAPPIFPGPPSHPN